MDQNLARILARLTKGQQSFVMKLGKEAIEQILVVDWLNGLPNVLFHCPIPEAKRTWAAQLFFKLMGGKRGYPDIFILESRGSYCGLFIELKAKDVKVYKKDGTLRKSDQLQIQDLMHKELRKRGYKAEFACGSDEAIKLISNYLKS